MRRRTVMRLRTRSSSSSRTVLLGGGRCGLCRSRTSSRCDTFQSWAYGHGCETLTSGWACVQDGVRSAVPGVRRPSTKPAPESPCVHAYPDFRLVASTGSRRSLTPALVISGTTAPQHPRRRCSRHRKVPFFKPPPTTCGSRHYLARMYALRILGGYVVVLLMIGLGGGLATDYRGMRHRHVRRSLGFADPSEPHPSWQPVPQPSKEGMIRRQDTVTRIVGWVFLLAGVLFGVTLSAELVF